MYLIKQYIITNRLINKILNYIKFSLGNASNIGKEIALYNYNIYEQMSNRLNNNINTKSNRHYTIIYHAFYNLINKLNKEYNLNISLNNLSIINISHFFYKFNRKLYKLKQNYIYSYLRGYYINKLDIYSSNINSSNINSTNANLYFVLYDFNNEYLDYIYNKILNSINFPAKIKYLKNTYSDKYSINDLTDTIPYKLVFLHKIKYYNNIIYELLSLLFLHTTNLKSGKVVHCELINENYLNDEELNVYNIFQKFK